MLIRDRLPQYLYLMRLDKPIGILLLLWPTLWALWLATNGHPDVEILSIFVAGVVLMRSAGCVVNDYADRHFDKHVKRTHQRPLASGKLYPWEALVLAGLLTGVAFLLVLQCNFYTICLSFVGAGLAATYPLLKRVTNLPQVGLGAAYSWGIPMAFAAEINHVPLSAWVLFCASLIWSVIYDTMYAMVDRDDDLKIGVKSTAILFSSLDKMIIGLLQLLFIVLLVITGLIFGLNQFYFFSLIVASLFFAYQQWLIYCRSRSLCFKAFLNNNWVGLSVFVGIVVGCW